LFFFSLLLLFFLFFFFFFFFFSSSSSFSLYSSSSICMVGRNPAYRTSAFKAVCTLTPVLVPPVISRGAHASWHERPLLAKGGIMDDRWPVKFS
jgi:hypothetical protein